MAIVDPQNLLPENIVRSARLDAERLLSLTNSQRAALFKILEQFTPSTSGIDREETDVLAQSAAVDADAVESAIRLAYILRKEARIGQFTAAEITEGLRRAFSEAKLDGADKLFEEISPVTITVARSFNRVSKLERAMPSLLKTVVACDLRYLPRENSDEFDLAPIAIVRLELDEIDDVVFQCTPQSIRRLIRTLDLAATTLDTLDKFAQQRSKP